MRQNFLDYLTYEKRYSPHTVTNYGSDLEQLEAYLADAYEINGAREALHIHLRSWTVYLFESGVTTTTVKRKVSAVRAYFRWLKKFHGQQVDPTLKLALPKTPRRLPIYVEEDQMQELATEGIFPDTFEGRRDRAIVEMFYQTGIRSAELIGLKTFDLDLQKGTIKVLGKRNKERIVPVSEELFEVTKVYLAARMELSIQETDPHLFLTAKGRKLYPKLVYNVVNTYLGIVSSLRKKSPHVLRHTFATHMLNRGADLNAIKELLGHSSLAATQVYTHNSVEKLKNIHREAHPNG